MKEIRIYSMMLAILLMSMVSTIGIVSAEYAENSIVIDNGVTYKTDKTSYIVPPAPVSNLVAVVQDSTADINLGTGSTIEITPPLASSPSDNTVTGVWFPNLRDDYTGEGRIIGSYAGQEIQPRFRIPDDHYLLFAPTLITPNSSLESTSIYRNDNGKKERLWGVFNHFGGGFVVEKSLTNPKFLINYVRQFPEGKLYFTEVLKVDNKWYVLLYNFRSKKWEIQYSEKLANCPKEEWCAGWSMFEHKFNTFDDTKDRCPNVPEIESTRIQVLDKGGWSYKNNAWSWTNAGWYKVTPDSGYGYVYEDPTTFSNCGYIGKFIEQNYHWQVYKQEELKIQ